LKSFSPWKPDIIDEQDISIAYDTLLETAGEED